MFTEAEAKTKYCPQQADPAASEWPKCDASACMAWRWAEKRTALLPATVIAANPQAKTIAEAGPLPMYGGPSDWHFSPAVDEDDPFGSSPAGWTSSAKYLDQLRKGFCGLAGPVRV